MSAMPQAIEQALRAAVEAAEAGDRERLRAALGALHLANGGQDDEVSDAAVDAFLVGLAMKDD